ncbi:hypothetical protein LCGC14_1428550, partial [marine sediment metagenome]
MNLTEQFDGACTSVSELLTTREKLIEDKLQTEKALADNDNALRKAICSRDSLSDALSIIPVKPQSTKKDELRKKRR